MKELGETEGFNKSGKVIFILQHTVTKGVKGLQTCQVAFMLGLTITKKSSYILFAFL